MSNLFQKTSSNWARYDKYEWKEDKEGTLYITPSPDAKVSLYNPLKDSEQIVLKAVNLGLMCMDKDNTQEQLQNAIMDFVTCYGLLGFMTALPTTPDFITYHAVYLTKNHFIILLSDISLSITGSAVPADASGNPHRAAFCTAACALREFYILSLRRNLKQSEEKEKIE